MGTRKAAPRQRNARQASRCPCNSRPCAIHLSAWENYQTCRRFLIGRVFYTDAANTFIIFMGIYLTNEIGFTETEVYIALMSGIAAAALGGITWGFVVDWIGPKPSLLIVLGLWSIAITLTFSIPLFGLTPAIFWAIAPLGGFSLGSTWAADRPLMLRLAPAQAHRPVLRTLRYGGTLCRSTRPATLGAHR